MRIVQQLLQHLEAIQFRHLDIQQHQIVRLGSQHFQPWRPFSAEATV